MIKVEGGSGVIINLLQSPLAHTKTIKLLTSLQCIRHFIADISHCGKTSAAVE